MAAILLSRIPVSYVELQTSLFRRGWLGLSGFRPNRGMSLGQFVNFGLFNPEWGFVKLQVLTIDSNTKKYNTNLNKTANVQI